MYQTSTMNSATWLNSAMARVYGLMFLGLLVSTLVGAYVSSSPAAMTFLFTGAMKWVVLFAPLVFIFVIGFALFKASASTLRALYFVFTVLFGLTMAVVFKTHTTTQLLGALVPTTLLFGAMSVYGYFTKKDLSGLGNILFFALIGIIIAGIVNIFLQNSMMQIIISSIAVIVFLGFTAYDTQQIRENLWNNRDDESRVATMGALNLYLDFVNLFLNLLQLGDLLGDD